jgi:hypothetical protein
MNYQRLGEISEELFYGGKPDRRLNDLPLIRAFSKFNAELIALVKKWEEDPDDTE